MKIIAISDTHGMAFYNQIPECDILLHCGDFSPMIDHSVSFQKQWFFDDFIPHLKQLPAKHIAFIAGNHDFFPFDAYKQKMEDTIHEALPSHIHYLRDSYISLNGIVIHGSPWITMLKRWAFYDSNHNLIHNQYKTIPDNVNIIMTHAPVMGYCDTIMEHGRKDHLGNEGILNHLHRMNPRYILCGHIHSGNHNPEIRDGITFHNVSLLDENYDFAYKPLEITWLD